MFIQRDAMINIWDLNLPEDITRIYCYKFYIHVANNVLDTKNFCRDI